jgi:hypothetical protein
MGLINADSLMFSLTMTLVFKARQMGKMWKWTFFFLSVALNSFNSSYKYKSMAGFNEKTWFEPDFRILKQCDSRVSGRFCL